MSESDSRKVWIWKMTDYDGNPFYYFVDDLRRDAELAEEIEEYSSLWEVEEWRDGVEVTTIGFEVNR